jgi:predicted GH43/DUF377 family glycosyl hydrolase
VEDRRGLSHFCAARSANGTDGWIIDPQPTLVPDPVNHPEELWRSRYMHCFSHRKYSRDA